MRWEELEDALEVLQSEREYDGYFCSIKDAVIIVILGSLCDLKSVKKIHAWATSEQKDGVAPQDALIIFVPLIGIAFATAKPSAQGERTF